MKKITLKVPNNKFQFFMELIKSLDFVKVESERDSTESPYDPEFVAKIQNSRQQAREGKVTRVKKEDLKEFLDL